MIKKCTSFFAAMLILLSNTAPSIVMAQNLNDSTYNTHAVNGVGVDTPNEKDQVEKENSNGTDVSGEENKEEKPAASDPTPSNESDKEDRANGNEPATPENTDKEEKVSVNENIKDIVSGIRLTTELKNKEDGSDKLNYLTHEKFTFSAGFSISNIA